MESDIQFVARLLKAHLEKDDKAPEPPSEQDEIRLYEIVEFGYTRSALNHGPRVAGG